MVKGSLYTKINQCTQAVLRMIKSMDRESKYQRMAHSSKERGMKVVSKARAQLSIRMARQKLSCAEVDKMRIPSMR